MKPYCSSKQILAEIERILLENQPSFHRSPLEQVVKMLTEGRRYSWVGIYLSMNKKAAPNAETAHPAEVTVPGTRKKIVVAIRIAGREVGSLGVESDRENAFGAEERVLLEQVATLLARFLTGPGKYLVRRAMQSNPASPSKAAAA